MSKKKKIRVPLRKNRQTTPRQRGQLSQRIDTDQHLDELNQRERISRKGSLTRNRTIVSAGLSESGGEPIRDVDLTDCLTGRVIGPRGGECLVETDDGRTYLCAVRRLLKSLATTERAVVAAGDRVVFRPSGRDQGLIERVEPR